MAEYSIQTGIDPSVRADAVALYWDAFKGKLGKVMGPGPRARAFFTATINPDFALSAVGADGYLLGIAGFKTVQGGLTGGTEADMTRHYGRFGGLWRGLLLAPLEREIEPGVLLMDGICVDARARGTGVGTALLYAVKGYAADLGLQVVRLDVVDSNPRARALYERQGFVAVKDEQTGPLRHVFGFRRSTTMHYTL